ncbi:MAG: LAGLIDADG family homing endonuclease [bacterium]
MIRYEEVKEITAEEYFNNNQYSIDMFNNKYAHTKKNDEKETPAEVFKRVSEELAKYEKDSDFYFNKWFDLMYKGWFRPGGSIISGIGSGRKSSTMNCFSNDTEFITSIGVKKFSDFNDGDKVDILSPTGTFKKAIVKKFGKQDLYEVIFRRNNFKFKVKCTPDHLWKTSKGEIKETKDLYVHPDKRHDKSDKISLKKRRYMDSKNGSKRFCPIGFVHGLVFGDGYFDHQSKCCRLNLRGDSIQYKKYFENGLWNIYDNGSIVDINYLPNYMKEFPDFDNINDEYILGFFIGWFAADGSIDKDGRCELSSSKYNNLEIISNQLQRFGIYSSNIRLVRNESPFDNNTEHKLYSLYIWKDCLFDSMFVKDNHIKNYNHWKNNKERDKRGFWFVDSVIPLNIQEDVWCIEEPEYHMFVLKYGIPTHNCSTIPIEGDSLEDISKAEYTLMKCAAYRQGVGIDLSNLRPRGSKLGNAAEESTGTIPWGKKFSDVGKFVGQQGRMPAVLESLKIDHPDIEEFINCKRIKGEIENANISVQITDEFMNALENDKKWKLYFETKREVIEREVDANHIFDMIADSAWESAEPGVQYIDKLKNGTISDAIYKSTGNPIYKIVSTNACSEKPLASYNVCNLLSINMEMFSTDKKKYKKELKEIIPYLVRLADNVITYELENDLSPIPEQKYILEKLREIGMGITNLHGWLLKDDIQYDSDEAIKNTENFVKWYAYYVFKASVDLGEEKGNAPAWNEIKNKEDLMYSEYISNIVNTFFDGNINNIKNMRNLAHMSIAPTGSLSNSFPTPCISSGVEPIIAPYYWRRTRAMRKGEWDYYFVIPNRVKEYVLKQMDKNSDDYKKLSEFSGSVEDNEGKIGLEYVDIVKKYVSEEFFKPAHKIDFNKKIELMSGVYKWVDAAVSCTFNLPKDATKEDVKNIYLNAYYSGVRAVSVYREGSREGILIFEDPLTHKKQQNKGDIICGKRPEDIKFVCAPKRPEVLTCNIHHCSVKGEKWLVLIGLLNDEPYEIFAGEQEDLYVPKSVQQGEIIKKGGGVYSLRIKIRRANVEYDDIANELMTAEQRSLTRILSLCLRHGVPHEFIVGQLKKANGDITDFSNVVSRILSKYIKELYFSKNERCPICGEMMIIQEGCMTCISCHGYSKCGG